ncbi:hypothetical protein ABK040_016095 [Willaertia magna]
MKESFFNHFLNDTTLTVTKINLRIYKYLRKKINLFEIKNLVFDDFNFHEIASSIKQLNNINNCEIIVNDLQKISNEDTAIILQKIKNLKVKIHYTNELHSDIKQFIIKHLSILNSIYLVIRDQVEINQLIDIFNFLKINKINTTIQTNNSLINQEEINDISKLMEYKDYISLILIKNNLLFLKLAKLNNLTRIDFVYVQEEIILENLNQLEENSFISCNQYKDLLFKNKLQVNVMAILDIMDNDVENLQYLFNQSSISLQQVYLDLGNEQYRTRLQTNNLQNFTQIIKMEKTEDYLLLNNINNYNVHSLDLFNSEKFDIKLNNFHSLKHLISFSPIKSLEISNLINLKTLRVFEEINNFKINFLNLSQLQINKNKNLNINLLNLPKLKRLNIEYCENVNIKAEKTQILKLRDVYIFVVKELNINLELNSPELFQFYLSYIPKEKDIIHIEFYKTPILKLPTILMVNEELYL